MEHRRLSKIISHISTQDILIRSCNINHNKNIYISGKRMCLQNTKEYQDMLRVLDKLKSKISLYSNDYRCMNNNNQVYEIKVYNIYNKSNRIEKWWWVDISNIYNWINFNDILILNKYGWYIDICVDSR